LLASDARGPARGRPAARTASWGGGGRGRSPPPSALGVAYAAGRIGGVIAALTTASPRGPRSSMRAGPAASFPCIVHSTGTECGEATEPSTASGTTSTRTLPALAWWPPPVRQPLALPFVPDVLLGASAGNWQCESVRVEVDSRRSEEQEGGHWPAPRGPQSEAPAKQRGAVRS